MSNIGVIILDSVTIKANPDLCSRRLQIEDNIGEAIHIHWRNVRFDFSVRDFLAFAASCKKALGHLEDAGLAASAPSQHAAKALKEATFDRDFMQKIGHMKAHITGFQVESRFLDDLFCITYVSAHPRQWKASPIIQSMPYIGLQGNSKAYQNYARQFGEKKHTIENLKRLQDSIKSNGYPHEHRYIVLFGDQPYIRDGQHRAAILRHLHGNIKIPILRVLFQEGFDDWRMHDQFASRNIKLPDKQIRKILLVRLDAIGDSILSASMLSTISNKFANAHISVLCQKHIAEIYASCPNVQKVIPIDKSRAYRDEKYQNTIITRLQKEKYDLALHPTWSRESIGDLFAVSSKAKRCIGFNGDDCNMPYEIRDKHNSFYSDLIASRNSYRPEIDRTGDFLEAIGIKGKKIQPTIWMRDEDLFFAERFFAENNLSTDKTIVLFAGTLNAIRKYDGYGEAIASVCESYGLTVVALGGSKERLLNQVNLDAINGHTINMCGQTSIRQSAAIIQKARLAVGAETGLAHIACAVGTPNVVLLGGGHFGRFMPYSPLTTLASLPLDCFACNWRCRYSRPHCICDIAPHVLQTAVKETLDRQTDHIRLFVQDRNLWEAGFDKPKWCIPEKLLFTNKIKVFTVGHPNDISNQAHQSLGTALHIPTDSSFRPNKITPGGAELVQPIVDEWPQLDAANKLYQSGQLDEAYLALDELVERYPDYAQAHNDLGVLSYEKSDTKKALYHYRRAVSLEPQNMTFQKNLADFLYFSDKDVHAALNIYTTLLRQNPEDTEVLFAIGYISAELGNTDDANLFFNRILEIDPEHHEAQHALASKSNKFLPSSHSPMQETEGNPGPHSIAQNERSIVVSAIVSVYNAEKHLEGCLEDLLAQSIADKLEIIIVDSGSLENEASIVRRFQKRYDNIHYIRTEERETVYAAWNRGIKIAQGRYITNANCDDRHKADAFETMSRTLDQRPDVALVYADCLITETENETFGSCTPVGRFRWLEWDRDALLNRGCFMGPQPMWRRSIHEEYGYFDPEFITSGDYEFWLRISQTHDFYHIPQFLGLYLRSPQSIEHSNRETQANENKKILNLYRKAAKQKDIIKRLIASDKDGPLIRGYDDSAIREKSISFYEKGNYEEARNHLVHILSKRQNAWEAYRLLVDVLLESGQASAIPEQLHALEGRSDLPPYMLALIGSGYEAAGDLVKAADYADQAMSKASDCPQAWNLKGVLAFRNSDVEMAAQHFHAAIEKDPDWGEPWTNLGTVYWEQGDPNKALDALEKGCSLSPTAPNVATAYHAAVCETAQYERAQALFTKIVEGHPDFKKARYLLIDILIRLEGYTDALAQIESLVVRFGPDPQLLEAAKTVRAKVGPVTFQKSKRPSLSLCMIVKNEEKYLPRCLESLKPLVDEMIIVDTGSSDATRDIAEVFGAKVFDFKWNDDFAAARNHSLEQATGDWILVMDADEVIAAKDHKRILKLIRKSQKGKAAFLIMTRNYTNRSDSPDFTPNKEEYPEEQGEGWVPSKKVRLFLNRMDVHFVFPVHEQVDPVLLEHGIPIQNGPFPVHHYGKLDARREPDRWQLYYEIGKKKLNTFGDSAMALKEMAIQASLLSYWGEAKAYWHRYLELKPDGFEAHLHLTRVMAELGDFRQAHQHAAKAAELSHDRPEPLYNLALSELQIGQVEHALQTTTRMCRKFPEYMDGRLLHSLADICAGNSNRGLTGLGRLTESMPREDFRTQTFSLLSSLRDAGHSNLVTDLAGTLAEIPCLQDVGASLQKMPRKDGNSALLETFNCNVSTNKLFKAACRAYENEDFLAAIKAISQIVAVYPDHWHSFSLLADVLLESGQASAIPGQLHALEERSDLPAQMLALIGSGCEAAGDLAKAADYADQAISKAPDCPQAWSLKGVLAFRNNDLEMAARHFHTAIEHDSDWGEPWTNLGTVYWEQGQPNKALDALEKGCSLSPTAPNVATAYHAAVCETAQYERAKDCFTDIVEGHPDFKKARYLLIDILIRLESYTDALAQIETLVVRFGPDPQLLEAAKAVRAKVGPVTFQKSKRPSLSLCIIVKNEEKYLPRCLESLKPLVDEMIIVDTGSSDATRDIAAVFGAKVFDFEWNDDFAAARNHSLDQATGDWILVMDADEVIAAKDHKQIHTLLKKSTKGKIAYTITTRNYTHKYNGINWQPNDAGYSDEEVGCGWIPSTKTRLFKNTPEIRFEYPVHELVDPALDRNGYKIKQCNVPVHHYGLLEKLKVSQKGGYYYKIGKKKLEKMENDPNAI